MTNNHEKNSKLALYTLTMGGFSIGMTEFLIMGILPDVAHALQISIPTAGYLIAIYAFGVVIGAPLLIRFTDKIAPKTILSLLMLLFFIGNLLFALAPSFLTLLITRFISGLPHGAFFGVGAVVAKELAPSGKSARAIALMFAGLTLANILGVPFGTYLGHHYSWRLAYALVGLCGLITLNVLIKFLPNVHLKYKEDFCQSLKIFKQREVWLIMGISGIGTAGLFTWISYIAPLMTDVAQFSASMVTFIMMLAGLGMAFGNYLGGLMTDRLSPLTVSALMLTAMIACLLAVALCTANQTAALILTFITGAVSFTLVPTIQMLMIENTKGAEIFASSIIQSTGNLANTLGAFLGGIPLTAGFGYTSPEYVGIALVAIGLLFCMQIYRLQHQEGVAYPT